MTTPEVPPGWYDDQAGSMRWWDGASWTEHVAPASSAEVPPSAASSAPAEKASAGALAEVAKGKLANFFPDQNPAREADATLWSATARTMTGLSGGRCTLTADNVYVESGVLSTSAQQIPTFTIASVSASQSMTQKARGVGDIVLTLSAGPMRIVRIPDIPQFREGVQAISAVAHTARERMRLRDLDEKIQLGHQRQTINVNRGVSTPDLTPQVAAHVAADMAEASALGLHSELAKVVRMREEGLLNDEEFTAAKRKILGL